MIEGLFVALQLCALTTFARSNEIKGVEEVRASRNSVKYGIPAALLFCAFSSFVCGADGKESVDLIPRVDQLEVNKTTTQQSWACQDGPCVIMILNYQTYINGTVAVDVDGQGQYIGHTIDSSNGFNSLFAYNVTKNLTIRYQDWEGNFILLNNEALSTGIDNRSCVDIVHDPLSTQAPSRTIFSDFYRPKGYTRRYPKTCNWTLQTPPQDTTWRIHIMDLTLYDKETLLLTGSLNGTKWQLQYGTNNSSMPRVQSPMHSDTEVQIRYNRPNPVVAHDPAFIIFANKVTVREKNCSLAYDKQTFTSTTGKFTNIVSGKTYPPNEKCTWSVVVPERKQLRIHVLVSFQGLLSGDTLTVTNLQTHDTWVIQSVHSVLYDTKIFSSASNTTFAVTFTWETDEAYEYFGFDVNYFVEDTGTPNVTTTLTPPPTTSRTSMRTSTTTLKSTTPTSSTSTATTSSTPHQFGSSQNALKIAVLMCFIRLIMPL